MFICTVMGNCLQSIMKNTRAEVLSGLTVGIALVPEAIAFALIAGVAPLVGLYAAFIICLVTSLFGGRPGMISGATGAIAVVLIHLTQQYGVEYLFATVVLMGIFQILSGIFHLGRFIKMVPHSVMIGFVNGLAIVILLSQFNQFKSGTGHWIVGTPLMVMFVIIMFTMVVIYILPKFTTKVPSTLVAIILSTVGVYYFGIETKTVGDIASISGGLPTFHIPMVQINFDTLKIITPYALIIAIIGLIESLLTLTLIDDITNTKGKNSRECFVQGVANFITGFFGGMGGCAMVGQSMINIKSGGRGRLSGVVAALSLLVFILFLSSLIELIPIATLVGVMFVVVIATFKWSSFKMFNKIPSSDFIVIVVVTVTTVFTDLAIAVVCGVVISSLVFAWNTAKHIYASTVSDGTKKTYIIHGQVFFASIEEFKDIFNTMEDENDIIIDFQHTRVWDQSAVESIEFIAQKYLRNGKNLALVHLSPSCQALLDKARNCIVANPDEDPSYRMAVLQMDKF